MRSRRTIRKMGKVVPRAEERKKERRGARGSCGEALGKREVREKMCYGFYSDLGLEEREPARVEVRTYIYIESSSLVSFFFV